MSRIFACNPTYIAIDFDGTCVSWNYPDVGDEIGATDVLRELVAHNHLLILFTTRANYSPCNPTQYLGYLDTAINWFEERGIPLVGINAHPNQHTWCTSNKAYASIYIDDEAIGCPLIPEVVDEEGFIIDLPCVDWNAVRALLVKKCVLPEVPFSAQELRDRATYIANFNQLDLPF